MVFDFGVSKSGLLKILQLASDALGKTDTQTITNKQFDVALNNLIQTTPGLGAILVDNGTKMVARARPAAHLPLHGKSDGSDIEYSKLEVAGGGTGQVTLSSGTVLIGAGTSGITTKANPAGAFLGTSDVQNNTGLKTFFEGTFGLRNPANSKSLTFTNPVITNDLTGEFMDSFDYLIHKSGSNYVAKRDNWSIESSNSDAATVLQYAINNSEKKGVIAIKGANGITYDLTAKLDCVDKNVYLFGLNTNNTPTAASPGSTATYGGVVFRKAYGGTNPLIDMTNTVFTQSQIKNIQLVGDAVASSIGIKAHDVRSRTPFLDNVYVTGFDTGIELSKCTYVSCRDVSIDSCITNGLNLTATAAVNNTLEWYGGRINSNPTNIKINNNCANDVKFFSTVIEGKASGHTNCINSGFSNSGIGYYGCSFEKNGETNPVIVLEDGNNTTYLDCRFDCNVDYTPIHLTANARNIKIIGCWFQVNTAAVVGTILLDSGSVNTMLLANTKGTNTVGSITLTDNSGGSYTALGNAAIGVNDFIKTPQTLQDYTDKKVITIPSDPSSGYVREYPKATDANTDSLYLKAKLQGTVTEMNYFP